MNFIEMLRVVPGITSVAGSGGKTTLLRSLAERLPGTVVLATSTRFLPFDSVETLLDPTAGQVRDALGKNHVVCVASPAERGKLQASASLGFAELAAIADYVLVEADGSKRLPLKAHAPWEPVIPQGSTQTILVVGASGLGLPVEKVVHRPEVFCELAGCDPHSPATPEAVARVIAAEGLASRVVVNQAESPEAMASARRLADALHADLAGIDAPVLAGSIRGAMLQEL